MTTPQDPYPQGQPNPYEPGQPNPYGQNPSGMPPAAPPLHEGELRGAQGLPAPQQVQISFWLWVVTAAMGVLTAIVGFTQRDTALEAARRVNTSNLSDDTLQAAVTFGLVLSAVFFVVVAGLYLLFAFKARAGRNWARIVLTVLTAISVLFLAVGFSILSAISTLVAVIAVVLLYLPASNQFYAASRRVVR